MAKSENHLNLESSVVDLQNVEDGSIGVAFKRLQVVGTSSREYQNTVGNYIQVVGSRLGRLLWSPGTVRRPIVYPQNGLVKGGEMLLVLGRPGSGCSTFLKTIAGDTYGFTVTDDVMVNYQGMEI
jgi:ATP-binding cassette subfamily G (WHITE) protein 2 (PDR)